MPAAADALPLEQTGQKCSMGVSMFVSPIIENDRVVQHFVAFLDITDRVAREEERRKATETLDRRLQGRRLVHGAAGR
jgi:hypothetical protein